MYLAGLRGERAHHHTTELVNVVARLDIWQLRCHGLRGLFLGIVYKGFLGVVSWADHWILVTCLWRLLVSKLG